MLKPEKIVKTLLQKNSQQKNLETGDMFNWTFLTIQIEQLLFNDYRKLGCSTRI
jgi:hypothetical protein